MHIGTGGLKYGVMNEALKGAKENGRITISIMPTDDRKEFSESVDIPILYLFYNHMMELESIWS